jgi:hypothetical protein
MNRGVMIKALHELWPTTLLLGLILMALQGVLSYVLPTFQREFSSQILQLPFIRTLVQAMLGMDVSEGLGPRVFGAIAWVHPVVLATVWAHAIICCTRTPAAEVDRGTIDVLLSLPISRWGLYCSETLVWLGSAVLLMCFAAAGNTLGSSGVPAESRPGALDLLIVLTNLLCLYLAVGAASWLLSSLSDRRGRAIGVVFVLLLASFLLNYLAQFWEPAQRIQFLSLLRYYRPMFILRDGAWPLRDLSILLATALVLWVGGGIILSRRDLATL